MWRAAYSPFVYIAFVIFIFIPLVLLGFLVVPIALIAKAYYKIFDHEKAKKKENPDVYHFSWKFMKPWDNPEDGIANETYFKHKYFWLQVIKWTCLRNPVNGLRTVKYLSFKPDPNKIRFKGTYGNIEKGHETIHIDMVRKYRNKDMPHWYFAWHGFYTCIFIQHFWFGSLKRFWIGWKIVPADVLGVAEARKNGAKFAQQWRTMRSRL